jgi:hypothetical protein
MSNVIYHPICTCLHGEGTTSNKCRKKYFLFKTFIFGHNNTWLAVCSEHLRDNFNHYRTQLNEYSKYYEHHDYVLREFLTEYVLNNINIPLTDKGTRYKTGSELYNTYILVKVFNDVNHFMYINLPDAIEYIKKNRWVYPYWMPEITYNIRNYVENHVRGKIKKTKYDDLLASLKRLEKKGTFLDNEVYEYNINNILQKILESKTKTN